MSTKPDQVQDPNLSLRKVHILDPQLHTLEQPQLDGQISRIQAVGNDRLARPLTSG
jgi:hypothetical protein